MRSCHTRSTARLPPRVSSSFRGGSPQAPRGLVQRIVVSLSIVASCLVEILGARVYHWLPSSSDAVHDGEGEGAEEAHHGCVAVPSFPLCLALASPSSRIHAWDRVNWCRISMSDMTGSGITVGGFGRHMWSTVGKYKEAFVFRHWQNMVKA